MPPIGKMLGASISSLEMVIQEAEGETAEVAINYGMFIDRSLHLLL